MKKKHLMTCVLLSVIMIIVVCGCTQIGDNYNEDTDILFQVSTLNALMLGDYDGLITVDELLQQGNTGLGTFDTLEGEMIVADGVVYQAKADGSVVQPEGNTTVPFAAVTHFDSDISLMLSDIGDIESLKAALNETVSENNVNIFYMATVKGDFTNVHVRSVPAQQKPYKPLSEVAESQTEFEYNDISGTLIALYCPDYISGINLYGWHIHFISSDGTKGGHVLEAAFAFADVDIDITDAYHLVLPNTQEFAALDLANDMENDTKLVESK
jgi:acetolactate decarboxylase